MQLIPFIDKDYSLLVSWISDEEFNLLWGGPLYSWPITIDQVAAHQAREEVSSFLLTDHDEKVGFIELIKESDSHYRLCRILIAAEIKGSDPLLTFDKFYWILTIIMKQYKQCYSKSDFFIFTNNKI